MCSQLALPDVWSRARSARTPVIASLDMTADASTTAGQEAGSLEAGLRNAGSPGKSPKAKTLFHGLLSKLSRSSSRSGDSRGSSRPCSFDDRDESRSPAPVGPETGMASGGKMPGTHDDAPRRRGYSLDVRSSERPSSGRSSRLFQALAGFSSLKPVNRLAEVSSEPCSAPEGERHVADCSCGRGEVAVISMAISAPSTRGCSSEALPDCQKPTGPGHAVTPFAAGATVVLDSASDTGVTSAPVSHAIGNGCDVSIPAALDTASAASWHTSLTSTRPQPAIAAPLSASIPSAAPSAHTVSDAVAAAGAAQATAAAVTVAAAAAALGQRAPGANRSAAARGGLPNTPHSPPETCRASPASSCGVPGHTSAAAVTAASAAAAAAASSSAGGPHARSAAPPAAAPPLMVPHQLPSAFAAHNSAAAAAAAAATTAPEAPAPAAPAPPLPVTRLLAVNPGAPEAMRRPVWCLEDYDVHRRLFKSATSSVYAGTCLHSGLPVALKASGLGGVAGGLPGAGPEAVWGATKRMEWRPGYADRVAMAADSVLCLSNHVPAATRFPFVQVYWLDRVPGK